MSNVSIYEKNWIDLVFEGKNKAYGAYQLRQETSKTSLIALISGVTFFCGAIGLGLFLTSFGDAAKEIPTNPDVIIQVDAYNYPPEKNEEPEKDIIAPLVEDEPTEKVESEDLIDPTIVKTKDATDVITKNEDLGKTKTDDPNPNGGNEKGIATSNTGGTSTGTGENGGGKNGPGEIIKSNNLDVLPKYPGGIDKFYEYVALKFNSPDMDENGQMTMSVIMSFVIEVDGTLTDIKALRSTNPNMEKEAIRILKASKVKWSAGMKDGKPVRTLFMLPIKVKV